MHEARNCRGRGWTRPAALLVFALALGPAEQGGAQARAWDQQRVTALAMEFAQAVERIDTAASEQPPQPTAVQQRSYYATMEFLRLIENTAERLVGQLQAGRGYVETVAIYFQIQSFVSSAREHAQNSWFAPSTVEAIDAARSALGGLAPYYEDA